MSMLQTQDVRVLHVITQLSGRAGAELSLRQLMEHSQGAGLRHAITVVDPSKSRFEGLDEIDVPVFVPSARTRSRLPAAAVAVDRAISAFRPDVVHTSLFEADLVGRAVARLRGTPVLTSLVNTPYAPEALRERRLKPGRLTALRTVDRLLARRATTAFHALTEAVADAAVRDLGLDRRCITVVPRGRDRATLGSPSPSRRAAARRELGVDDGAPLLLNVARQDPQKGHIHLLRALPAVIDRYPNARLVVVGRRGSASPDLDREVARLGLADAVTFTGVRHDVADLLCGADVFVFPSMYEGLGGAVIEAMALRTPVVAADVPALREVLDGGRYGLLTPPGRPQPLAEAILSVFEDPAGAADRAAAAEARFESTYRLDVVMDAMRRLYQEVVAQAKADTQARDAEGG